MTSTEPPPVLSYAARSRPIGPRTSSRRQFLTLLLMFCGIQAWIVLGRAQFGEKRQVLAALLAGGVGVFLATRPGGLAWFDRLRQPTRRTKFVSFAIITLISIVYLFATARLQHRDLAPILHDEHTYFIQAKMLAGGKLWLPRHDLAEFFDSFHLITDRVYASKYGPGAAMFFAPAALVGLPTWLTPLLLSGVAVGLIYLVGTELFDGSGGYVAAMLLLSLGVFRRTSTMVMSQAPMLVLVLLAMLAFVWWRRDRWLGWVILMGVAIGWGALTRPIEAVCVAVPLAAAILFERPGWRVIIAGLAAVTPFLALQMVYNKGVTGRFTEMPWKYYGRQDPYDAVGRSPAADAGVIPPTLPQKRVFIEEFTRPAYHRAVGAGRLDRLVDRTALTLSGTDAREELPQRRVYGALPSPLLIMLLPVGLLGLAERKRWALCAGLPLFLLIYSQYAFFFSHYAVVIAPAVIINLLAGVWALQATWPLARWIGPAAACVVGILCVTALPELNPSRKDQWFDAPLLRDVDQKLATLERTSAVVLFRFDPERMIHEEPVYNLQAAWPDDAPVIRAHDFGEEKNRQLFGYYAARQPDRAIYRYDESNGKLTFLGTAQELAK